jgi:uncharacterized protein (TIGR02996 family)
MTSDGEALLRAICEQPWEDTPRLVYADCLEENGDPLRAEFIRVQCALANESNEARRKEMRARADQLHKESHGRWTRGSPAGPGVRIGSELHRGFYHEATFMDDEAFGKLADKVFAWTPIDSLFVMRLTTSTIARVLQSPNLGRLKSLTMSGDLGDAACDMIAETSHLARLTWLRIVSRLVRDSGAMALAKSPHLAALESLHFSRADGLTRPTLGFLKQRFRHFGAS